MADVVDDYNFELALHLSYGEFLVHAFLFGSEQYFRNVNAKEYLR